MLKISKTIWIIINNDSFPLYQTKLGIYSDNSNRKIFEKFELREKFISDIKEKILNYQL